MSSAHFASVGTRRAVARTVKNARSRVTRSPISGRVPPMDAGGKLISPCLRFRNKKPVSGFCQLRFVSVLHDKGVQLLTPQVFSFSPVTLVNDFLIFFAVERETKMAVILYIFFLILILKNVIKKC